MAILAAVLAFLLLLSVGVFWHLLRQERELRNRLESEREAIEGEEDRLFHFLHDLGEAISQDASQASVQRILTEGAAEVAGGTGAILYLHEGEEERLVPSQCTRGCPPLIDLPERIVDRARKNPATLHSFLRLHAVESRSGIFGACVQEEKAFQIDDIVSADSFNGQPNAFQVGVSAMLAPLVHHGRVFGVLAVAGDHPFSENDFAVFQSVADQSAFAVGNAIIHQEALEKRRLEEDLRNAGEIQQLLLPRKEPLLEDYTFAAFREAAQVLSGDYYDYMPIDEQHYGIVIGDVSGKGVAASLVTAMCRSVMRAHAPERHSPGEVLAAVNRVIFPDMKEDMFVSSIYLVLEKDSPGIMVARAGHPPVFHWRARDGELLRHEPKGVAMGLDAGTVFERVVQDERIEMEPGDCLLLYTDGILEAADAKGLEYGCERLQKLFVEHAAKGPQDVAAAIENDVKAFRGDYPATDDITLIAIQKR